MPYGPPTPTRLCAYCWDFPVVAITTGARHRNGSRKVAAVICPACKGTGTRPVRAREAAHV
ncbi:hypothetical protein AB0I84_34545 [Streptomyces spectabilis]|uniref:hypothetical protein n=1 Tax=Streptomyces spectabilis TaxID=68270 RepID=UPI00340E420A